MDSQNSATLVSREADTSKPKTEDTAKIVLDPVAGKVSADTDSKKAAKRSSAADKNTPKEKTVKPKSSKAKKPKKTVVIEMEASSDSESDSDSSSVTSDLSTDEDTSDSESSSSEEGAKKHRRNKKRRDNAKSKKRMRSKKSKKPIKIHDISESESDSGSDSERSSSSSRSGTMTSASDSDSVVDDGPIRMRRLPQNILQDSSRLMYQQQAPPPMNMYQPYAPPMFYGAPMGTQMVNHMGYGGGIPPTLAHIPPAYTPPPPPPIQNRGLAGRRPPPVSLSGNRLSRDLLGNPGDLFDNGRRGGRKSRKSAKKRSSKSMNFKRVDQVWDNSIHNYKLQDTAEGTTDAEYEGYLFHVRRTFDWEGKYKQTLVDIKSKLLREGLQEVMGDIKGVSMVEETPKLDPNLLFLYLEDMRKHVKVLKNAEPKGEKKQRKKEAKRNEKKRQQLKILVKYLDKDYEAVKNR